MFFMNFNKKNFSKKSPVNLLNVFKVEEFSHLDISYNPTIDGIDDFNDDQQLLRGFSWNSLSNIDHDYFSYSKESSPSQSCCKFPIYL